MANQLSSLPWRIDTLSALPIWTGALKISYIAYVGYTDAGHSVEVLNGAGELVCLLKGAADLTTVEAHEEIGWVRGLIIPETQTLTGNPNMPSGQLLIHLE